MLNDRLQEIFLVIGDKLAPVNKKWWYGFAIALLALIPFYYLAKFGFVQLAMRHYSGPQIIYSTAAKEPLQILEKKIFALSNNSYAGYVKIKNINLEWGVPDQAYAAEFKTLGGTVLATVSGSNFILPASEKLIVFSRFTSDKKPDELTVALADTHFVRKPDLEVNFELQRIGILNNPDGLVIIAGIKNLTAYTIKQIDLPVVVYNTKNEIIGVNSTSINNIQSFETRTFQYLWPIQIPSVTRAEINPEVNVFDRSIFMTDQGISPFANPGQ